MAWQKAGYKGFLQYDPETFEIKYGDYRFNGDYFGLERKKYTVNPSEIKSADQLRQLLGLGPTEQQSQASKLFGVTQSNMPGGLNQFSGTKSEYIEEFTNNAFAAMQSGKPIRGASPIQKRDTTSPFPMMPSANKTKTTGYGSMVKNDDGTYDLYIAPELDSGEDLTNKVHKATWDIYNQAQSGRGKTPKKSLLA